MKNIEAIPTYLNIYLIINARIHEKIHEFINEMQKRVNFNV